MIKGQKYKIIKKGRNGQKVSPEWNAFYSMIFRCYNVNSKSYPDYGGKGITVCDRWRHSFYNFIEDMGLRPSPEHSLERINNELGYSPENCKWATAKEQARNRRNSVYFTYNGQTKTIAEWSEESGIIHTVLTSRIKRGVDPFGPTRGATTVCPYCKARFWDINKHIAKKHLQSITQQDNKQNEI